MNVLIACEYSGRVREAFRARGHNAWSCDLLPAEDESPFHFQGDVLGVIALGGWDLMVAHPPCTRLANSGVRWLSKPPPGKTVEQMQQELLEGAAFYRALRDAPIPLMAIENPIMHRYASALVNPGRRQVVQPWHFGDPAFKATGFELIGLPGLRPTNVLTPPSPGSEEHKRWSAIHRASPGPNRWKDRSRTFPGIAAAMADQWG
jgi:hypothetical protein